MSDEKVNEQARQAYAASQKESDAAHERDAQAKSKKTLKDQPKTNATTSGGDTVEFGSADAASLGASEKSDVKEPPTGQKESSGSDKSEVADLESELNSAQEQRISELKQELEAMKDDLARARADLYNLQQEYNAYARRTKAEVPLQQELGVANVVNALMSVLDDIDLARQHGDLVGSFEAVANKLEQALEMKFKVKRYGIKGDTFDPNLHQAIQMLPGMEGKTHVIDQVAQPGYLMGERVLRPAMVVVAGAEAATETGAKESNATAGEAAKDASNTHVEGK